MFFKKSKNCLTIQKSSKYPNIVKISKYIYTQDEGKMPST